MYKGRDSSAGMGMYKCDWKTTGVYSVDMVLACVSHYRKMMRPIKSITLSKYHYDKLDDYFKMNHIDPNASIAPDAKYTLDGVDIVRAETFLVDDLMVDFWPTKRTEKDDEKYFS